MTARPTVAGTVAAIVTHNPDESRLRDNIESIVNQVAVVLVLDNGSTDLDPVRALSSSYPKVRLIEIGWNSGIGHALNRGARYCIDNSFPLMLTLDQDSVCPPNLVDGLASHMTGDVATAVPRIADLNKMTTFLDVSADEPVFFHTRAAWRGAITSGALVRISAWRHVGGYDEMLFIDYVDYDFNQRLLLNGYRIAQDNTLHLSHEVGKAEATWLRIPRRSHGGHWSFERFYSFGHSSFRCYYKARNRVIFTRRYGRKIGITHEGIWQLPQQVVLTLVFERERRAKAKAFYRGIRDGIRFRI